ncbi:hypothetical protein Tmath_0464 [Thermoanaerobacter mathranii subsp. mathranii str. A3]|uniref:DUF4879 domain-containing protein n=3 Tax=Thermoanaerobacteraceae TaxID=186814 RepID=D3T6T9_THEIA|nr:MULTISPECIES: DUF4879 domain-containing protein [Thermoanaerobacter]ADD01702.1 hypothetical protein Thit_0393 [Thermoanaerobacter italicus Ab9]ADH60230.1 hypothetical protein Tmath_0464 [Thermoanaerobacter mathranii subsp. mathranii str. A3]
MMKKIVIIMSIIALFTLVLSVPVQARELERGNEKNSLNSSLLIKSPMRIDEKVCEYLKTVKENYEEEILESKTVQSFAAAPPLTYLQVYAVISSQHPTYEYFSENQLSSVEDHGGDEMYIVTIEIGYGHLRFAKMNGSLLNSVQSQPIDLDNDSIIDGWFYWWDASGYDSGDFTYQNTSSNYPWNTMSDFIHIK